MAFGTQSKIFRAHIANDLWGAGTLNYSSNTVKAALFGDTPTPNQDASLANTSYGVDQWIAGSEKSSSTDWPVGGQTLGTKVVDQATAATAFIDAADTPSGPAATLSDVRGTLVYNDSGSAGQKYGLCFNSFGGAQAVTAGTFTIVWAAAGIARITL